MNFLTFFKRRDWRQEATDAKIAQARAEAKADLLEPLLKQLRDERDAIEDRLMTVLNLRTIHAKPAPATTPADRDPIKPVSNIRDWTAMAQAAEDKAFQEDRTRERQEALKQIQETKEKA